MLLPSGRVLRALLALRCSPSRRSHHRDRGTLGLSAYGYDGQYKTSGFALGVSLGYGF